VTTLGIRASVGWLGPGRLVEDPVVLLEGSRIVYAGTGPPPRGVVADDAGRSQSLSGTALAPQADQEIVLDGFLMPGAVDRHVHVGLSSPQAIVRGGVTAARDLAWPADDIFSLAEASEGPSFDGPLIRAAGPMLTCPGGYPTRAEWAPSGTGREVRGADEAAAAARDLVERGAAILKVAVNADAGPTLSDDELLAICGAAHDAGTIVTAHVQGRGQAARTLGAGVDELAHCPWSERLSDELIRAMARQVRIVSTLDIHSHGRDTPELRTATDNLRRFLESGGRVTYGTDLGNGPIPPGIHVGEAFHLYRSGLRPERVLEALTHRPLGHGEPADLVVLGGNPLENLAALGDVQLVVRGGRRFL
jgi:imidazolonepropionase-like amidohydrolase